MTASRYPNAKSGKALELPFEAPEAEPGRYTGAHCRPAPFSSETRIDRRLGRLPHRCRAGTAFYRDAGTPDLFHEHQAAFDLDLLPVLDPYRPPTPAQDARTQPSVQRRQALLDWWERLCDYADLRRRNREAVRPPLWQLFQDASELRPTDVVPLTPHMDVDVDHLGLVTTFVGRDQVTAGDLVDERWTKRVWEAEVWAQVVRRHCGRGRVQEAHPFLWAADNPADEPPAPPQPLGLGASTWQNDSGLFELSFRDERYLPFEYRGTVGRFRIELPQEDNRFALDALADVVLRVDFTARQGGEALREAARAAARRRLPGAGVRLFDARHDFPDDWYALTGREATGAWPLRLTSDHFPFLPGRCEVEVTRLGLYVEVEDPGCRGSLPVTLVTRHLRDHGRGDDCDCPGRTIECLATSELPSLFHGVADVELRVPRSGHRRPIAVLRFPERELTAAYLVCGYRIRR